MAAAFGKLAVSALKSEGQAYTQKKSEELQAYLKSNQAKQNAAAAAHGVVTYAAAKLANRVRPPISPATPLPPNMRGPNGV
jgi:hypothetical protein